MKKLVALLLACMMVFAMAGCGAKEDFDAKGYVQGVLDATYHADYAAHAEDVGESIEDVKAEIEGNTYAEAESALAGTGIIVSDEQVQEYVDLIVGGYDKVTFTVGEAVKDDNDNFTVDVEVVPVGLLDNLESIFTAKLTAAVQSGAGEDQYMAIFLESVKESIDNAPVMDPVTVTLHVTYEEDSDGNRVYSVTESDLSDFENIAVNTL